MLLCIENKNLSNGGIFKFLRLIVLSYNKTTKTVRRKSVILSFNNQCQLNLNFICLHKKYVTLCTTFYRFQVYKKTAQKQPKYFEIYVQKMLIKIFNKTSKLKSNFFSIKVSSDSQKINKKNTTLLNQYIHQSSENLKIHSQ